MSEEPKEASEETPDELVFDVQDVLEDSMTIWQQAHAFEDMARMSLDFERKDMYAVFRTAQATILDILYLKMMSKQSHKVKALMQKHVEDIEKGKDVQYDRMRVPWEALQRMEENLLKEAEKVPEVPVESQFVDSVTPGHPPTCACYACEDQRNNAKSN